MTDFHSHVLPGIDDGSPDTATSLRMLSMWKEQNISRICATPHFDSRKTDPGRFLEARSAALDALMKEYDGGIDIIPGAEVRFFDGMSSSSELGRLCLSDTSLLLLEMPFSGWTDRMLREISEIRRRGLKPVLAHIERYLGIIPVSLVRTLSDCGVLIQSNAEAFLERRTRRRMLSLLQDGYIHFLGSDAHNDSSRPPDFGPALELIKTRLGAEALSGLSSYDALITTGRKDPRT